MQPTNQLRFVVRRVGPGIDDFRRSLQQLWTGWTESHWCTEEWRDVPEVHEGD
jgi:hypothetical protein